MKKRPKRKPRKKATQRARMKKKTKKPPTAFWTCRHCNRLNCLPVGELGVEVTTTCLGCGRQVHITPTAMKDALTNDDTTTPGGE